jgi:hypothetical protein
MREEAATDEVRRERRGSDPVVVLRERFLGEGEEYRRVGLSI